MYNTQYLYNNLSVNKWYKYLYHCMVQIFVPLHGTNICTIAWYKYLYHCMVQIFVPLHGTNICTIAWYKFVYASSALGKTRKNVHKLIDLKV